MHVLVGLQKANFLVGKLYIWELLIQEALYLEL